MPETLIAIESTANGVGNYFHSEWLRCKEGRGDKHAVFVPWYEIRISTALSHVSLRHSWRALPNMRSACGIWAFRLTSCGGIGENPAEYGSEDQMHAEYPTDDVEAFLNSGNGVFGIEGVESGCARLAGIRVQ